jgi:hypothetical protein
MYRAPMGKDNRWLEMQVESRRASECGRARGLE